MWGKAITAKARKFPGVEIETKVLDNGSLEAVRRVNPGTAYGHNITIGKLSALWPVPIAIKSTLRDTRQLAFRERDEESSSSWQWETTLFPDRVAGENTKLLVCAPKKVRNKDKIVVKVKGDDREEDLSLEVPIE